MIVLITGTEENATDKRMRWKQSNPNEWAVNVTKRKRSECLPYRNKKKEMPAKSPKPVNCHSCRFKCTQFFSEDDRQAFCKHYWSLDYMRQKDFLLSNVQQCAPLRKRTRTENGENRSCSRCYSLKKGDDTHRVCQSFFIKTLCISDGPIIHAFKNRNDASVFQCADRRGKTSPPNKTPIEDVERVKRHIEKFPVMESHYCRKTSKRLYLDSKLSICKMHDLYATECKIDNVVPVSSATYRRVFCTNYNYSFYKPKKDQCSTCTRFELATPQNKNDLQQEYEGHKKRITDALNEKAKDKERCKNDSNFLSASFDLQSVLQIPSSDSTQMYYTRKINVYNLTIYEARSPNEGYCIAWSELNGKRGSAEIGSALLTWLKQIPETVTDLSLFSDACGGQNRNKNIAALLLYFVQTSHLETIEHKFLESGHSYMEADSMHSAIESQKKYVPVFSMLDWLNIFRLARSSRKRRNAPPYHATELKFSDMKDLAHLTSQTVKNTTKDEFGNTVSWLSIKCLKYEKKHPYIIKYRYDYSSDYVRIHVKGRGRPFTMPENLKRLYMNVIPISNEKKNDLLRLCTSGVIPQELHAWYRSLPSSATQKNHVPMPAVEDNSEDELW